MPAGYIKEQIDVSHYARGIYFIEVSSDNMRMVRKIVLQ